MTGTGDASAFLASCIQTDEIRIELKDGTLHEGSYLGVAGMHFVHVKDGSFNGRVEGPLEPGDVVAFGLTRSREEVREEIRERKLGDPVPGRLVVTRDGIEARLERLAGAAAAEPDFRRRMQVEAQFDEVADMVELARTKRKWILAVARWRRHSNEEPDLIEMAGGDITMAEKMKRPRPQDFHPDQAERRRRRPLPDHVASDPRSPQNMYRALRRAGFRTKVSTLSEMTDDGVTLLVDFPSGKKAGRYLVTGRRRDDGAMSWDVSWEGGQTAAAMRRCLRARATDEYASMKETIRSGLASPSEKPGPEPEIDDEADAAMKP